MLDVIRPSPTPAHPNTRSDTHQLKTTTSRAGSQSLVWRARHRPGAPWARRLDKRATSLPKHHNNTRRTWPIAAPTEQDITACTDPDELL